MKTYRRKSKNNPWRNTRDIKSVDPAKVWGLLLMIFMPIMIISIASNATMRTTGVYNYNLSSSQILSTMTVSIDQSDLTDLFGKYMQHRTGVFQMKQSTAYNPQNVFNAADQRFMHNLRTFLDVDLAIGIIATIITGLAMFFLIRWKKHEIHMRYFKRGAVIFLIMTAVLTAIKLITPVLDLVISPLKGTGFKEGDALITIISAGFSHTEVLFEVLISMIIFGVLIYVTYQAAGRKKIFNGY